MSVNTKIHHYFSETPPARWDIQRFLEQELSAQGKAYDHNRALNNWISSLRHLSKGDNLSNASPANVKIESYYLNGTRGHPSDKTIAQKWHDRINRRGKKRKQDTSNLPLLRAQRIKNTFRVTKVNGSVNLHGAGANNATDGASAILNDSAEAAPAAVPDPPPASFAYSVDSDREELIETSHLVETLQSQGHLYNKMTNKFALSDGRFLEDLLQTHVLSLDDLSPAHFFIVDKELLEKVLKDTPDEVTRVMDVALKFPPFPENLRTSMLRYQAAKTTDECRNIARGSSDDEDVYWIDDVFRHIVKLITKSGDILSYDGLNEGVWDSLVYPPLWDEYLVTIPTIVLQRKEIPLVSRVPYPYRPGRPLHYDGVVQSRTPRSRRTEFAVFEVSRSCTDTRKIAADRDKLIGGCRAMLCSLMEVVEYDAEALSRLVVVGVLHAGRSTQLLTMSCLGRNVLIMSEGPPWELPVDVRKLTALYDIIHDVWKVKWAIQTTEAAVNDLFERKESRELEERGKKWGEEHVC